MQQNFKLLVLNFQLKLQLEEIRRAKEKVEELKQIEKQNVLDQANEGTEIEMEHRKTIIKIVKQVRLRVVNLTE